MRHGRRSLGAIGAIAFGTIALLLSGGFIEWILLDFREHIIRSQLGHIQIAKRGYKSLGSADPYSYVLRADDSTLAALAGVPGVRVAAPRLSFNGLVSAGDVTLSFLGSGLDATLEQELSTGVSIRSGQGLSASDPKGVLIGSGLAAALRIKPGDPLVLVVNTASGSVNAVDATVRGTFSSVAKAYDDSAIRLPIGLARQLLKVQGLHTLVLLLERTEDTENALIKMRPSAEAAGLEIASWSTLADFYNKTKVLFSQQIGVLRGVIALIVVLSVSNTMIMSVFERTWEIGTLMAIGDTRRHILASFLHEGALLGALGGAIGLIVGVALAAMISAIGVPMPPPPGMAEGYIGRVLLTPRLAIEALAIAVITTLIAAAYPAWRAARLPIVDALRHNRA